MPCKPCPIICGSFAHKLPQEAPKALLILRDKKAHIDAIKLEKPFRDAKAMQGPVDAGDRALSMRARRSLTFKASLSCASNASIPSGASGTPALAERVVQRTSATARKCAVRVKKRCSIWGAQTIWPGKSPRASMTSVCMRPWQKGQRQTRLSGGVFGIVVPVVHLHAAINVPVV